MVGWTHMQLLRIQDAILLLNSQTVHPTRTTNKKETRKQTWEAAQKSEIRDVSNFRWSFFFIPFETVRRRLERPNKIIFSFQNNDLSSLIWQKKCNRAKYMLYNLKIRLSPTFEKYWNLTPFSRFSTSGDLEWPLN